MLPCDSCLAQLMHGQDQAHMQSCSWSACTCGDGCQQVQAMHRAISTQQASLMVVSWVSVHGVCLLQAEVLWLMHAKHRWLAGDLWGARAIMTEVQPP